MFSSTSQINVSQTILKLLGKFIATLGLTLPRSIKEIGFRPQRHLIDQVSNLSKIEERSFFGASRIIEGEMSKSRNALSPTYLLPTSDVFLTSFELPNLVGRELDEAIALRLPEYSPIPLDLCAYDYNSKPIGHNRLNVTLALTKTKTLQSIHETQTDNYAVGYQNEDGRLYIFRDNAKNDNQGQKHLISWAAVFVGIFLLTFGVLAFIDRQQEAVLHQQQALLAEIKSVTSLSDTLRLTTSEIAASKPIKLHEILGVLEETQIPEDVLIDDITQSGQLISLKGFIPSESANAAQGQSYPYQIGQTSRPGFVTYTQNVQLREANDETIP